MVFATARNGIATPTAKQFHHLPAAGTFISEWCGKVEKEKMAAENLPEPMTPVECNLRGLPWMPLETARLLDSDLFLLSTGDEFKAAVTLWCKSWNQIPGGSLPSDERLLEALSGSKCWKKVRTMALRGWIRCSDGRLYHPVIAALAMQAWGGRQVHIEGADAKKTRQQRWREQLKELAATLRDAGVTPPANASKAELERLIALHVDGNVDTQASTKVSHVSSTRDAHEMANKSKCKGQGELIPSVPNGTGDQESPPVPSAPEPTLQPPLVEAKSPQDMAKDELWRAGKSLLEQAGMPKAQCGSFVGKLVKDYGDAVVVEAVRAAVVARPADPVSYLKATCQGRNASAKNTAGRHNNFDQKYYKGLPDDGTIPA